MDYHEKIKALRKSKGFTQQQVADALSIDYSAYGKIENGKVGLNMERAVRIADLFEVSIDELVGHREDVHRPPATIKNKPGEIWINVASRKGKIQSEFLQKLNELIAEYGDSEELDKDENEQAD